MSMSRKDAEELVKRMNAWIDHLDTLPEKEARNEAHALLYSAGIVDENHDIKEPYKAVFA